MIEQTNENFGMLVENLCFMKASAVRVAVAAVLILMKYFCEVEPS
jgi:hypothetical protein